MYETIITLIIVTAIYVIIDKMKIKFKNSKLKGDNLI
jgi:hypothetical protein